MGVVLMNTEAAAELLAAYQAASQEVSRRAAALERHGMRAAAVGTSLAASIQDLLRISVGLADDAEDVGWRRLWLLERDSIRLGATTLGWVPNRTLRDATLAELLDRADVPAFSELAVRSLTDPEVAHTVLGELGDGGLEALLLGADGEKLEPSLAVLLATASRSEAGLNEQVLDVLLPADSSYAARRIAAFGRMLPMAQFSDQVTTAAAAWATDPSHLPHIGLAMTKYGSNFAAAALGAVAATGVSAALFLTSPFGSRSLSEIAAPEDAFELSVEGDTATADLLEAVTNSTVDGTMPPEQSFEVWLSMSRHLQDSSLPGTQARLALAELTNLHWEQIRLLSTDSTAGLFAELAHDEVALATVSVELGARAVPLIAQAAEDLAAGRDIAAGVDLLASGYEHVFSGLRDQSPFHSDGGLVASALDTAISAAAAPAGPAVAWVAKSAGRELVDRIIVADHPDGIMTPRDLFEHEFNPSNTAVPDGHYPAVSAFELQVLNQVLRVDPYLAELLDDQRWFDGKTVMPPDSPSDDFARWFARSTSGSTELARDYQALRSEFSDKVLLEALKVESY